VLGLVGIERSAQAQDIQVTGPLKGAPAVRHERLYRQLRVEIAPSFSATLLDNYRRTILIGARLNIGLTDWLSIGGWFGYGAVGMNTDLTSQIDNNANRTGLVQMNVAPKGQFVNQVAQLQYMGFGQASFVPFRGKFSLFQSVFTDIDMYLFAGGGVVGTKERQNCGQTGTGSAFVNCYQQLQENSSQFMTSRMQFAPTWGLGFNMYLNDFVSLGVEYRMTLMSWNASGFDSKGQDKTGALSNSGQFPDGQISDADRSTVLNQLFSVYIGISLPTKPKITD
jgi:outer membrane beta-barrel protein